MTVFLRRSFNGTNLSLSSYLSYGTVTTSSGTITSSSTIPGTGEISGRAIKALGSATIRGVDYIVVRLRLGALSRLISQAISPDVINIDVYREVVEFAVNPSFQESIRRAALECLLSHIHLNQAPKLALVVQALHLEDSRAFLRAMIQLEKIRLELSSIPAREQSLISLTAFLLAVLLREEGLVYFSIEVSEMEDWMASAPFHHFMEASLGQPVTSVSEDRRLLREMFWTLLENVADTSIHKWNIQLSGLSRSDFLYGHAGDIAQLLVLEDAPPNEVLMDICTTLLTLCRPPFVQTWTKPWALSWISAFIEREGVYWDALRSSLDRLGLLKEAPTLLRDGLVHWGQAIPHFYDSFSREPNSWRVPTTIYQLDRFLSFAKTTGTLGFPPKTMLEPRVFL